MPAIIWIKSDDFLGLVINQDLIVEKENEKREEKKEGRRREET